KYWIGSESRDHVLKLLRNSAPAIVACPFPRRETGSSTQPRCAGGVQAFSPVGRVKTSQPYLRGIGAGFRLAVMSSFGECREASYRLRLRQQTRSETEGWSIKQAIAPP